MMFMSIKRRRVAAREHLKRRGGRRLVSKPIAVALASTSLMMGVGLSSANAGTVTNSGCFGNVGAAPLVAYSGGNTAVQSRWVTRSDCYPRSMETIQVTTWILGYDFTSRSWQIDNKSTYRWNVQPGYYIPQVPELSVRKYSDVHARAFVEWFINGTRIGWKHIEYTSPLPGVDYLCGTLGCRIEPTPGLGAYLHRP
jgi:hypothetical protein